MKKTSGDILLHMCIINEYHDVCMVPEIWSVTDRIFSNFGPFFSLLPPTPPNSKNQNFEKMNKYCGDINILHMCTINKNHMMYGSRDIEYDREVF